MDRVQFRIHPSVGMARFGDSPNWYFLGPEFPRFIQEQFPKTAHKPAPLAMPGQAADPSNAKPNGKTFRDSLGHIMPQAARFRVFAYFFNKGEHHPYRVEEVKATEAEIEWTATVANLKTFESGANIPNDPPAETLRTGSATTRATCLKPPRGGPHLDFPAACEAQPGSRHGPAACHRQ